MRVDISAQAADDIADIITFTIANFGERQAREYSDGIYNSFDILGDNPKIGKSVRVIDDDPNQVRRYIYKSHYVFYEIHEDRILVLMLRHVRRQMPENWI